MFPQVHVHGQSSFFEFQPLGSGLGLGLVRISVRVTVRARVNLDLGEYRPHLIISSIPSPRGSLGHRRWFRNQFHHVTIDMEDRNPGGTYTWGNIDILPENTKEVTLARSSSLFDRHGCLHMKYPVTHFNMHPRAWGNFISLFIYLFIRLFIYLSNLKDFHTLFTREQMRNDICFSVQCITAHWLLVGRKWKWHW